MSVNWDKLAFCRSEDFAYQTIKKIDPTIPDVRARSRAFEVSAHVLQGLEFLKASEAVSFHTKMDLLYYWAHNMVKAFLLLSSPQKEIAINKSDYQSNPNKYFFSHHGLSFTLNSSNYLDSEIQFRSGVFKELLLSRAPDPVILANTPQKKFSVKEILSLIPETWETYSLIVNDVPRVFRYITKQMSGQAVQQINFAISKQLNLNPEDLFYNVIHINRGDFQVKRTDYPDSYLYEFTSLSAVTNLHQSFEHVCISKRNEIPILGYIPESYQVSFADWPISNDPSYKVKIPVECLYFLGLFAFSSISRYKPGLMQEITQGKAGGVIVLIEELARVVSNRFSDILNQSL